MNAFWTPIRSRNLSSVGVVCLVAGLLIVVAPTSAVAVAGRTVTWTGAVDANWSTNQAGVTNWVSGGKDVVPSADDLLVFPAGAAALSNDDILGLNLAGIEFTGPASGTDYNLTGDQLGLGALGIRATGGGSPSVSMPLRLTTCAAVSATGQGFGDLSLGNVQLAGFRLTLTPDSTSPISVNGTISGTGSLAKTGAGQAQLNGGNSYRGPTTAVAGDLYLGSNAALGTGGAANTTTVFANATLDTSAGPFQLPVSVANPIVLDGGQIQGDGSFTGPVYVTATSTIGVIQRNSFGPGFLDIAGPVSGFGGLILTGTFGSIALTGADTYLGQTRIEGPPGPGGLGNPASLLVGTDGLTGPVDVSGVADLLTAGPILGAVHVENFASLSPTGKVRIGGLALDPGGTLSVNLNGPAPGTGYDQLVVVGAVHLGGSLSLASFTPPPPGTMVTVIDNELGLPVVGTFAGLPQGSTFNGMRISYTQLLSHNVTLTQP